MHSVAPLIKVDNPSVAVSNGSSVVLECYVEAFPESVCYWERADGRSIDGHHRALIRDQGKYKVRAAATFHLFNAVSIDPVAFPFLVCLAQDG